MALERSGNRLKSGPCARPPDRRTTALPNCNGKPHARHLRNGGTRQVDLTRHEHLREQIWGRETPDPEALGSKELQDVLVRGNKRRPIAPNFSDGHKTNLMRAKKQWFEFCDKMPDKPAWKPLLKKLSYESKGEGEAFIRFVMSRKQQRIGCKNSAWTYTRRLGGLYHNFTGSFLEQRLKTCLLGYIQSEITVTLALRREPKPKPCIGLDLFGGSPLEDRGHEVRARR